MKFGAQLYSVCNKCQTSEGIKETFKAMKEMGYSSVQLSGFPYNAEEVRAYAEEVGIHVGLTHTPIPEILNNTDEVIRKHLVTGADTVGIGYPTGYMDGEIVKVEDMVRDLTPAVEKIQAAGLNFAFHNHHLEFKDLGGYNAMDYMYENTNWNFILDTGWVNYTGTDVVETIKKYKDRLKYVHLKDFREPAPGDTLTSNIVPLYYGAIDFDRIIAALEEVGTCEIAYVEQDTAHLTEDPYGEMKKSIDKLREHGWVK